MKPGQRIDVPFEAGEHVQLIPEAADRMLLERIGAEHLATPFMVVSCSKVQVYVKTPRGEVWLKPEQVRRSGEGRVQKSEVRSQNEGDE